MISWWRSVNGTFGVSGLGMRGEEPNPVPCGIVEGLIAASDTEGLPPITASAVRSVNGEEADMHGEALHGRS